jgi:hypothetical protein
LKKWLGGKRFANNEEVQSAVDGYFAELDYSHYKQGIEAIEHRWEKCIELKGDYVEKKRHFFPKCFFFLVRSGTSGTNLYVP